MMRLMQTSVRRSSFLFNKVQLQRLNFCTPSNPDAQVSEAAAPLVRDMTKYEECLLGFKEADEHGTTPESIAYGKRFKPQNKDIILISPPKSGTIWAGFIVFLLKCKCDPVAIDKIQENEDFIPYLLACYDYEFFINDPDYTQEYLPRLFMKHANVQESYVNESKDNCRILTLLRDPQDAIYSFYRMWCEIFDQELNFDGFAEGMGFNSNAFPGGIVPLAFWQSWAQYYKENKFEYKNGNVLTIFYDDLINNRLKCIQEIEKHLDINSPINQSKEQIELEKEVFRLSSFEEMYKIGHKLNFGRIGRYNAMRNFGLSDEEARNIVLAKNHIRKDGGKIGQGKQRMPQKWAHECDKFWKENIAPVVDCENYQQFRQKVSFCMKD